MCSPAVALLAISAATTAVSVQGQKQDARTNRRMLLEQARAQAEEIRAQRAIAAGERTKAARAERARMAVAAGEAGVSGISVDDAMFDSFLQEDLDLGLLAKDEEFALRANQSRLDAGLSQARGPSGLEAGLAIAGSAYSGYSSGLQIQQQRNRLPQEE